MDRQSHLERHGQTALRADPDLGQTDELHDRGGQARAGHLARIFREIGKMGPNQFVLESYDMATQEPAALGRFNYLPTGEYQRSDVAPAGDALVVSTGHGTFALRTLDGKVRWTAVLLPAGDTAVFGARGEVLYATPGAAQWLGVMAEPGDGKFVTYTPAEFDAFLKSSAK